MAAAYNTYLRSTINLITNPRLNAIRDGGLDSFNSMSDFEDEDVKTLVSGVRKNATNPISVNAIMEKKLKVACFGARLYTMISRTVDSSSLNTRRLREIEDHKKIVKDHKDPTDDIAKVTKTHSIDKALDTLPNFLRSKLGVRGVALSYVIRDESTPPALEALLLNRPYADISGSLMNELIIHTPHTGAGWDEDNATVFALLQEMVRDSPMASSLKRHQRSRDGRSGYLSLVQHNLGSAQWDRIILKAEEIQSSRVWNGKNGRYSLRRHVDMHRDAYNDMTRASENVGYEVPNERTRVTRLLRSIHANHMASVAAAKTTIEATPAKRDDFELAADFLILNAPSNRSTQNEQRISMVNQNYDDGDMKTLDELDHAKVEDRFYTQKEYKTLSIDQKCKLKLLREKRDRKGTKSKRSRGKDNSSTRNSSANKFKKLQGKNKSLKQRISALESKAKNDDNTDDESTSSEAKEKVVSFNQRSDKSSKKKSKRNS